MANNRAMGWLTLDHPFNRFQLDSLEHYFRYLNHLGNLSYGNMNCRQNWSKAAFTVTLVLYRCQGHVYWVVSWLVSILSVLLFSALGLSLGVFKCLFKCPLSGSCSLFTCLKNELSHTHTHTIHIPHFWKDFSVKRQRTHHALLHTHTHTHAHLWVFIIDQFGAVAPFLNFYPLVGSPP